MPLLHAHNLSRKEDERLVLNNVSFSLEPKRHLAVAGATGSGKTTLLKLVAGLLQPTAGSVVFAGERVKGPEEKLLPGHPSIAYLSQQFELRNHYRVAELLDMAKIVSDDEAKLIAGLCRVDHLLGRWSHQLSGGERQRIALARTLVAAPRLLLLDEPFSNLDPLHKNDLKAVLFDLRPALALTTILVSHEPADTLSWADEVLVLQAGQAVQTATPEGIYRHPANDYVAGLFGKYNRLTPSLAKAFANFTEIELRDMDRFLRPEELRLTTEGNGLAARVERIRFLGQGYELLLSHKDEKLWLFTQQNGFRPGEKVFVRF